MRRSVAFLGLVLGIGGLAGVACSAGEGSGLHGKGSVLVGGSGGGTTTGTSAQGGGAGGIDLTGSGGSISSGGPCNPGGDADHDGFDIPEDCNDCDPNVNPGAVEVPTDPMDPMAEQVDENCDGNIDEAIPTCDSGMPYTQIDPESAAKAMDICTTATMGAHDYGVLQARWVKANGANLAPVQAPQFGIQANFGPNVSVQGGERMLVLSSGFARLPGQTNVATNNSGSAQGYVMGTPPMGYPQGVPNCLGGTDIYDDVGLELKLRAPTNATGFKYRFKFYSFEFAEYVCTTFNDQYIALVNPPPMGSQNGNISFDSAGNPVSVNIAFFDVCDPAANNDFALYCSSGCPPMPNPYCPSGPGELLGNGFDDAFGSNFEDAGATTWLETTAPIKGGDEFTIRFAIWDTGDTAYDSSVLLDGFEWLATPGTTLVTQPPPQ